MSVSQVKMWRRREEDIMRFKKIFCFGVVLSIVYCGVSGVLAKKIERISPKPDVHNVCEVRDSVVDDRRCIIESFRKNSSKSDKDKSVNGNLEKILVIPLEFNDIKFESDDIEKDCEDLMEEVKKYYEINSDYQKDKKGITIEYKVIDKITSEHDMSYYSGAYASILKEVGELVSIDEIAKEAVSILKKSGFNFDEYDNDNDGIVDHIIIVHAGGGKEETPTSDLIWSHRWEIQNNGVSLGNVRALNYTTVPEKSSVGVVVHELGHDFGLPDLYDTFSVSQGVGLWDVMGAGSWNFVAGQSPGECPSNLSAWSREFLGWGDIEEVDESKMLTFSNTDGISNIYKIYLRDKYGRKNKNEYYLLEYRRRVNYDEGLPGEGILIWHIDNKVIDKKMFANEVNTDIDRLGVELIQADGKFHLNRENEYNMGDAGDPFPGSTRNNNFAAVPYALNYSNKGEYSFIEGKDFVIDGDKAKMYIDIDAVLPHKKVATYAPLDGSVVGKEILFSFDLVPKCSEYKLQISHDENFSYPMQYNISGSEERLELLDKKIIFSKDFSDSLEKNTTYYWRVAATNPMTKITNVIWSDIKKFCYTNDDVVVAPSNFIWDTTSNKPSVSWVKEDNANGYVVICNGEEEYVDKNIFELTDTAHEYNIRVRSVGDSSASAFGNEVVVPKAVTPEVTAKVSRVGDDGMLPEYILLNIENALFKENGNYNKSTVNIRVDTLPYGIKQGDVWWLNDNTVVMELDRNDTLVLNEDAKLRINISKYLLSEDVAKDLKADVTIMANNKYYNDRPRFSFSGVNAKKIIGTRSNMDYSIDGGVTYNTCDNGSTVLSKDELKKLNQLDGIIVREKIDENFKYHIINILNNTKKPMLIVDKKNKLLRGLTKDMEFSFDGVNWNPEIDELIDIKSLVAVRYKGHGRMKEGESVIYDFRIT